MLFVDCFWGGGDENERVHELGVKHAGELRMSLQILIQEQRREKALFGGKCVDERMVLEWGLKETDCKGVD